jgi:hypothetical protein
LWQPVGKGTSLAISRDLDCPTPSERPIENNGEIRHLSNRFHGAKNENPGALAGASGAMDKASQLQPEDYTDAPDAARRIDRNGNWKLARNDWKRSIRRDVSLSYPARMVAWSLCDDFANHETGFCNPKVETLAHASGVSLRACQRALAELSDAGLICIAYAQGRGDRSEISFMSGHGEHALKSSERVTYMASRDTENLPEVAPIRPETMAYPKPKVVPLIAGKGASSGTAYIRNNQTLNQKERAQGQASGSHRKSGRIDWTAHDRAVAAAAAPPEAWTRPLHPIKPGSDAEADWNRWLAKNGHPTVAQVAPKNHAGEFGVPFRRPPNDDDAGIEVMISHKWVRAYAHKAKDRANA